MTEFSDPIRIELKDFIDEDVFYPEESGLTATTSKSTRSSSTAIGIFAGGFIAGLLLKRK